MTTSLLFKHPYELKLDTEVTGTRLKGGKLRIKCKETIAEAENSEGGDCGVVRWETGRLDFNRVFRTQTGDICLVDKKRSNVTIIVS